MQNIMQSTEQEKPWHKHPLVWMVIAIPFSAVIMGVVMIWLAVDTDDGLVADDYYKQGLAINDVISLDKKASELQLAALIEFEAAGKVVNVQFDKGLIASYPETLQLSFQHATHADSDVTVILERGMENRYIGYLKQSISEGVWYFEISNKNITEKTGMDDGWKLNARQHVSPVNAIKLTADY